jgi:site-specific recombinase XerD
MHDEWVSRFVDHHACLATRQMYASDLRDLSQFLARRLGLSLPAITEEHALAWRTHLEARSLAPATIARKLAVARRLFAYLADLDELPAGLPVRNPFRRIRAPKFDRTVGKTPCPSPEDVRRLRRTIGSRNPQRRRDLLIVLLLFNQGLRISELARLERSSGGAVRADRTWIRAPATTRRSTHGRARRHWSTCRSPRPHLSGSGRDRG